MWTVYDVNMKGGGKPPQEFGVFPMLSPDDPFAYIMKSAADLLRTEEKRKGSLDTFVDANQRLDD